MGRSNWRERREAYLRERGRKEDLIREGYETDPRTRWEVIAGGRKRPRGRAESKPIAFDKESYPPEPEELALRVLDAHKLEEPPAKTLTLRVFSH